MLRTCTEVRYVADWQPHGFTLYFTSSWNPGNVSTYNHVWFQWSGFSSLPFLITGSPKGDNKKKKRQDTKDQDKQAKHTAATSTHTPEPEARRKEDVSSSPGDHQRIPSDLPICLPRCPDPRELAHQCYLQVCSNQWFLLFVCLFMLLVLTLVVPVGLPWAFQAHECTLPKPIPSWYLP